VSGSITAAATAAPQRALSDYNAFTRRIGDYTRWRDELTQIIQDYQGWVETQGLTSGEDDLRIYELLQTLQNDKLVVAMVAEFSRGKSELINAIFFSDFGQRLLPSDAGRTTMCPTEILWDEKLAPCLRLLPIGTRKTPTAIAEYKRMPAHWTVVPLDTRSPKAMADTLQALIQVQTVTIAEAQALGLHEGPSNQSGAATKVQIPVWRHAIINFPHPLLKQGLVILDTPGLNSLGMEPELTLSLLPSAHAMLFLLAADAGVTKSDLQVWTDHVRVAAGGSPMGRFAVLNKIDTLWDELRDDSQIKATLARQVEDTARALGIPKEQVFPISAQKGLVAKVRGDLALLARSGLPALELRFSTELVAAKQHILRNKITRDMGSIIETTKTLVEARRRAVDGQLAELRALSGKSQDAIQAMIARMREEKAAYDRTLASFQSTRAILNEQIKVLVDYLSIEAFDALSNKSRQAMQDSWTTRGLKIGMKTLFDGVVAAMDKAGKQTQQIQGLVQAIYNKFHTEHKLARLNPVAFSLEDYHAQLATLYEEAANYRDSPVMMMSEQHFVIKKFFITLVSRTREVFNACNGGARAWSNAVMAPVLAQVREHKIMMDHRLENLKKIHENLNSLGARIADLEAARHNLSSQAQVMDAILGKITTPSRADA
jgi:hypothetical protein